MIFLTAGHHHKDSGAVGSGFVEAKETIRIRNRVTELIRGKGVEVWNDDDTMTLQTVINGITRLSKASDIVCDIHFNAAGNKNATGCEVFVPEYAIKTELLLAADLSSVISNVLGIRNRMVKRESDSQHKRLGMMRPSGINVLIEVAFISNESDMKAYQERFEMLCDAISTILQKHLPK